MIICDYKICITNDYLRYVNIIVVTWDNKSQCQTRNHIVQGTTTLLGTKSLNHAKKSSMKEFSGYVQHPSLTVWKLIMMGASYSSKMRR